MPSTRRAILAATVMVGAVLAGCNDSQDAADEPRHKVYVRNETDRPYNVLIEILDENDDEQYTENGDGILTPDEAAFFGPFSEQPATIRVVAEPLHDDQEPSTWTKPYRPPEEECTKFVLNRLFLKEDSADYDTTCSEY